jgi:hypothetical protein
MARRLLIYSTMNGRILGAFVTAAIALGIATPAAAQTNTQACAEAMFDLQESRDTLEELETVVATAKANRGTLQHAALELSEQISAATSPEQAKKLRNDRMAVLDEIETIDSLLPPIESQANALARQVAAAEQLALTCTGQI